MRLLLSIAFYFAASAAFADIVQLVNGGSHYLYDFAFGQSFIATAGEPNVGTVSFLWGDTLNRSQPDPTITLLLRHGAGFSGEVLASQTVTSIPDSTPYKTWIDFDFPSPVALIEGETYTLHFKKVNIGGVSGSYMSSTSNPYPDGTQFFANLTYPRGEIYPYTDLVFRVLSIEAPEPSLLSFVIVSISTTVFGHRRRRLKS